MREKLSNRTNEHEQTNKRASVAVERALDGFAPDGESWRTAKAIFEQTRENGRSYNEALAAAEKTVNEVAESKGKTAESRPGEAEVRFWDNMDPDVADGEAPTPAIERALNGYASSGGKWTLARDAFNQNIAAGSSVEGALFSSLTIANDGAETHPEVARDRFYGGVDPDYADADHYMGHKYGLRVNRGSARIEVGIGGNVEAKRQRRLGELAAAHSEQQQQ